MHVGVFSYYYLPVINGVTLTIADWKKVGQEHGAHFSIYIPYMGKNVNPDVISFPAVPLFKRFGITVPMFPEQFIKTELSKRKIDRIHVHHPHYIGNLAIMVKKTFHIPVVFTYHTRYTDYMSQYFPWIFGKILTRIAMQRIVRFMNSCDAITAANEALKSELISEGVQTPIYIVPPGVDTKTFANGKRVETRKRFGIGPDDQVLVYVGRLAKEKNIYFLMKSFVHMHAKNPLLKLLLVGNGLEEQSLRVFVQKNNLSDRVIFANQESYQTIPDVLAASDIFIYASQTETYGRVIVEAMAAGLPVVALSAFSIVDLIKNNNNGIIVFKKSPRVFATTVLELLTNTKKRAQLGNRAQKEAQSTYDSAVSWQQLHNVYLAVSGKGTDT